MNANSMNSMIIKSLLLIILFAFSFHCRSQVVSERWSACFGGSASEEGSGILQVENTYWIVSNTASNNGDISYNHGAWDIWLVRIDSVGNLLSEKTYGGSYAEGGFTDIKKLNDSTFYLICDTKSIDGDIGENPWPGVNGNYWVVQINKQGEIVWEKVLGGSGIDWVRDATVTNDGGIIVLGISTSGDGDITEPYGAWDLWMVKLNQAGVKQWNLSLGGSGSESGAAVKQTSDGGYIIAGCTDGFEGGNYDTACNHHGVGFEDAWIIKLDSLRTIQWQQCYGGYFNDCATNILELQDGYAVLGSTNSNDGDVSGFHGIPGNGESGDDIWVFKIDLSGNLIWQRCLGGSSNEFAWNIFSTCDGGMMIIGHTGSPDGDVEGYQGISHGIYEDVWFAKLNSYGELTWQYCYGGGGREQMYRAALQKSDYNYVVAFGTDTDAWQCVGPMYPDLRIAEIGDSTTGIYPVSTGIELITYPNPASGYVVFEYPETKDGYIRIINSIGQCVLTVAAKEEKTLVDVHDLPIGFYTCTLNANEYTRSVKLVIQ